MSCTIRAGSGRSSRRLSSRRCTAQPDPLRDGGTQWGLLQGRAASPTRCSAGGRTQKPRARRCGSRAANGTTRRADGGGVGGCQGEGWFVWRAFGDTLDKLKGHLLDGFAARTHAPPQLLISHSDTVDPLFAEPARDDADSTDQARRARAGPPVIASESMPARGRQMSGSRPRQTSRGGVNLPESLSEPIVLRENEFDIAFTEQKLGLTFEVVQNSLHISGFSDSPRFATATEARAQPRRNRWASS